VAHDFNNLLTAMIGYCDLLLMKHKVGDPSFADVMQIKQNANRAANLVRQLLAFSRQQTLKPRVLNLVDTLAEIRHLLSRLLGEVVQLEVVHAQDQLLIKADQGQLEQVIVNLAVNARERYANRRQTDPQYRFVVADAACASGE
jgi:two-component system cell cycle sensor histidine kinase/response regulator CckA